MKIKMCREIDEAGRIVIPADLRRQYGLKGGSKVLFTAYDDGILIHSEDYIDKFLEVFYEEPQKLYSVI